MSKASGTVVVAALQRRSPLLWLTGEKAWQNGSALNLHGVEGIRIEPHKPEYCGRDLHGLDPAGDSPPPDVGVRHQQHHARHGPLTLGTPGFVKHRREGRAVDSTMTTPFAERRWAG